MYLRRQLWRAVAGKRRGGGRGEGQTETALQELPSAAAFLRRAAPAVLLRGCASFSSSACLPPPPPNPVPTISVGPKPPASGQGCAFISRTCKGLTLWYFFSFFSFRILYIKSNLISREWREREGRGGVGGEK